MGPIILAAIAAVVVIGCGRSGQPRGSSVDRSYDSIGLLEFRRLKDEAFRNGDSPLPEMTRQTFSGLRYFPPDPRYLVSATFHRFALPGTTTVQTTGGEARSMIRYGRFDFTLMDSACSLIAYKEKSGSEQLFVPFLDPTNGELTDESGRAISISPSAHPRSSIRSTSTSPTTPTAPMAAATHALSFQRRTRYRWQCAPGRERLNYSIRERGGETSRVDV